MSVTPHTALDASTPPGPAGPTLEPAPANGASSTSRPGPRPWTRADTVRTAVAGVIVLLLLLGAALLHSSSWGPRGGFSLLVGVALGITFERGRFCFYCIFREGVEDRNTRGAYALLVALGVGAIGYAVVLALFLPDPAGGRLPPEAHIGPVSWPLAVAGLVFGLGMALSGGCISGHLYRLGHGFTRAVPALVGTLLGFGLGFGTWNAIYLAGVSRAPTLWLPRWLGYGGALAVTLGVLGVLAVLLLRFNPPLRAREAGPMTLTRVRDAVVRWRWSAGVTGTIVGVVGVLAYLRVEPLGVTAQLGSVSRTALDGTGLLPQHLAGLDTLAGCATAVVQTVTENGWLVIGLVVASFAASLAGNRFRPTRLTVRGGTAALAGGVLLGWGAMTALGCTVGVLLSGISAFAVSGWVFGLTCLAGVWLGVRLRIHRIT